VRGACLAVLLATPAAWAASKPATVDVDARDAARGVIHAHLTIPVAAGQVTLAYPKWIPGEHGPTGPIVNVAGLRFTTGGAGGKPLAWRRDAEDMFAVHLDVPAGVDSVTADLDFLEPEVQAGFSAGASATAELAMVSWNTVVLYPKGTKSDDYAVTASLKLPAGWKYGTALPVAKEGGGQINFQTVSLTTLVDSPVLAGAHTRVFPLGDKPSVRLFVAADAEADLDAPPAYAAATAKLVAEARALWRTEHYRSYTFLLTLSDHVAHFGLEHHESSDDRVHERTLVDDDARRSHAGLLPHEYTHSWNGKFRRPADLGIGSFDTPMHGELLWVYEGLTTYLGEILSARSGMRSRDDYLASLALTAAEMEAHRGRSWRPLVDTAVAAQMLYGSPSEGRSWRRGVDFYPEGNLIWLEADAIIRQKTGGKASLDDFCRRFHGASGGPVRLGGDGGPQAPVVSPYTLDDVVATLNEVAPYDWKGFFASRVYATAEKAPLGGIEAAGWTLSYGETMPKLMESYEKVRDELDARFSIGVYLNEKNGVILDVVPGSPAAQAGVAPGMKLVAVNGWKWNKDRLRDSIRDTKRRKSIDLLVESGDEMKSFNLTYSGGLRYPRLERATGKPDLLSGIIAPLSQP